MMPFIPISQIRYNCCCQHKHHSHTLFLSLIMPPKFSESSTWRRHKKNLDNLKKKQDKVIKARTKVVERLLGDQYKFCKHLQGLYILSTIFMDAGTLPSAWSDYPAAHAELKRLNDWSITAMKQIDDEKEATLAQIVWEERDPERSETLIEEVNDDCAEKMNALMILHHPP